MSPVKFELYLLMFEKNCLCTYVIRNMWGRTYTLNVLETSGSPNKRIHVTRNTKLYPDNAADWRWNPVLDRFFVSRVIARMFTGYKNLNICIFHPSDIQFHFTKTVLGICWFELHICHNSRQNMPYSHE